MKLIIALALIFAVALSVTNLSTVGSTQWNINYAANSANSSNTDVTISITSAAAVTATQESVVGCASTGVANYSLAAATTGLVGFGVDLTWTGIDISAVTLVHIKNALAFATTPTFTATTGATNVTGGTYANTSTTVGVITYSGQTETQLTALGLPNKTETFYWQCYSLYDTAAVVDFTGTQEYVSIGNGKNVTFSGNSNMGLFVSGAMAASAVIYTLF